MDALPKEPAGAQPTPGAGLNGAKILEWRPGEVIKLYRPKGRTLSKALARALFLIGLIIVGFGFYFFSFLSWVGAEYLFAPGSFRFWLLWALSLPIWLGIYESIGKIRATLLEAFEREVLFDWERKEARFCTGERARVVSFRSLKGITLRNHFTAKTKSNPAKYWCDIEVNLRGLDELLFETEPSTEIESSQRQEAKKVASRLAEALGCPFRTKRAFFSLPWMLF